MDSSSFADWFDNPQLSDVTFKIGFGDNYQEIKAHKIICVRESGYFEDRLVGEPWEGDVSIHSTMPAL